uniref:Uncharacterized protein n=1 Tax=Kalanchoe fedtschenkoi TaxID=63787 RepID=A0A7N0UIH4_KALFE
MAPSSSSAPKPSVTYCSAPSSHRRMLLFLYAILMLHLLTVASSRQLQSELSSTSETTSPPSKFTSTTMDLPRTSRGKSGPSSSSGGSDHTASAVFGAAAHEVPSGPNPISNR